MPSDRETEHVSYTDKKKQRIPKLPLKNLKSEGVFWELGKATLILNSIESPYLHTKKLTKAPEPWDVYNLSIFVSRIYSLSSFKIISLAPRRWRPKWTKGARESQTGHPAGLMHDYFFFHPPLKHKSRHIGWTETSLRYICGFDGASHSPQDERVWP